MTAWIAFSVIALVLVGGAFMVVRSTDLVHCVLWLALVLLGTAVGYILLHADFIAAVQVLLYTGGVVTLMLFAVMLTRRMETTRLLHGSASPWRGLFAAAAVLVLVVGAIVDSVPPGQAPPPFEPTAQQLGATYLTGLVLPFEVLSVLLLAAMIGAIVLARRDDRPAACPAPRRAPPAPALAQRGDT